MLKKIFLTLVLAISITGTIAFAGPSMGGVPIPGKVLLSQQEIVFTKAPFVLNGEIMVPAKDFFEKLGAQVLMNETTKEVISYRDNIFIKFKSNSNLAYVNGKPKSMPVSAMTRNGEVFIPASFAAETLEMNYETDSAFHALAIDYRENLLEYQQFGMRHFKRVSIANWGISFFIPEYWSDNEGLFATYGVENSFENFKLEAEFIPLNPKLSRSSLTESLVEELKTEQGESLKIISNNTIKLGEYTSDVIYYDLVDNDAITHHVLYVFYEQTNGYIFEASYPDTNDLQESKDIFDTIASTFSITKLSVNDQLEHYTELSPFYDYGFHLNSEIYSNMTVKNQFMFSGTVASSENIKGLHVIVTKDDDKMAYYVPIIDNSFSTKIYTPFGLGKHNITLVVDDSNALNFLDNGTDYFIQNSVDDYVAQAILHDLSFDQAKSVMKFSVLNVSSNKIKNLLSTDLVNYDNENIYNITNAVTFNLTNQYSKSVVLYEWITDQYKLTDKVQSKGLLSTLELIDVKEANSVELCILYTGLLRSSDIPARIVRGIAEDGIDYWVETYINGQWFVAFISEDVRNPSGTLDNFNLERMLFYENYISVEILPF